MILRELLNCLSSLGVKLRVEDGELCYSAPAGVLTPELRAELSKHKKEILYIIGAAKNRTNLGPVPVSALSRESSLPLSFGQERLWFLDQFEPGSSAYNIFRALRLKGHLNAAVLEQSLGEILRRHEALRTTFITENDQPVQKIAPSGAFILPFLDLSALPEEQREQKARELAGKEAARPFDLTEGPLLRATLLHLASEEHMLLVTMHHIVSDGWSMGIFCRELSALYEAFSKGKPSPLPELPIQYADFAVWQRKWLKGEKLKEQLTFWKKELRNLTMLELPADYPHPAIQTFNGAKHTFLLSQNLTEALRGLSRKEGVTLFMTLLAAFQCLLHRYTGQADIVVGTPIASRNHAEIEGVIGFFVNTLVMRTNIQGDPVFREFLKQVKKAALDSYTHQDIPLEKLVEELQPGRDLSRNPLFQVIFALQNMPAATMELSGLTITRIEIEDSTSKFDLEVSLEERKEGIGGSFVFNTDLFNGSTIERMAGHYLKILEGIVADPDQRLSELPLLTDAERHQLLVEWNDTTTEYARDKCIHELFEEQTERTPDAIAVVFEGQQLTYRELNNKANQLAHYLRKQGVGPEVLVGICVERSLEMIIGILGILKAGGAYLPLDPTYPKERLSFMISDAQAPILLTQRRVLEMLPAHNAVLICLDTDWAGVIAKESQDNTISCVRADNLAYVIYTSGSTGNPKGVAIEHHSPLNLVNWSGEIYSPAELRGVLASTSICFDLSVFELFATLCNGGMLILAENALHLASLLAAQRVTLLNTVPSAIKELLRLKAIPPSVRVINLAGEPLPLGIVQQLYQLSGIEKVYDLYGPSETTTYSTFTLRRPDGPCTIGRPLANTQIYLLDSEMQPVPGGVTGELFISGDGLARGYLNRPELTGEKFILNPFSHGPGALMYRTGDLARYLPDGNIEFLGRIDHQVKVRGYRIELGEIESTLGQHPFVRETIVIAREYPPGDKRLVAYVVPSEMATVTTNKLRNYLKEKLPDYMIPSAFVMMDSLPLTPNGKVDRKALPAPEPERTDMEKSFVSPRTPVEEALAGIWCEVLGLKEVGVHDNFFELGGHSLLATQVMSRLRNVFHVEIPLKSLFENPTIAALALRIAQSQAEVADHEEMDRLLTELEDSASDTVSESGESEDDRHA
jgi:amino acid adenylation domain-containing protein